MKALLLLVALAGTAFASAPPYVGTQIYQSTATQFLSGDLCVAASSGSAGTCAVKVDGPSATVTATTFSGAVSGNAATATSLAGGLVGQYPYQTAAGATAFLPAMGAVGIIVGNGTSAIPSTATLQGTASQVVVTQNPTNVTLSLPATINVNTSGNAATVTTNANLTGSDVTSVGNAATLNVATAHTWTGAIGLTNVALTATGANGNIVGASSITTASGLFGGSLSVGGSAINSSGALTLAANQAFTASGANGNITTASSVTASGLFTKSAQISGTSGAGTQCLHVDNSGNVTGTGSDCGGAANAVLTATQTFSGANTFTDMVTFSSGIAGSASFSSSSWTYVASQSFASTLTVPHFVSSVTIQTDGFHPLTACYYGTSQSNSGTESALGWAVWVDNVKYAPGVPQGTMGATAQFVKCGEGGTVALNCSACQPIFGADIPAAGVHTFAIYFWDPQNFDFSVPANYIVTDKGVWGVEQVR